MERVASDRLIAAASLDAADGSGRTLAVAVSGGDSSDTALGSGVFGKVCAYHYHGAGVAVKELKAGADEKSIGACFTSVCLCGVWSPPVVAPLV